MLAPLKDRSVLELDPGDAQSDAQPSEQQIENEELTFALRESRLALRRSAMISTTKIIEQANEINRLQLLNAALEKRLQALESGETLIQLSQKLMALTTQNEILSQATQRICRLDKALCIARSECDYLVQEYEVAMINIDDEPAFQVISHIR